VENVVRLMPMLVSGLLCSLFIGLMAAHVPLVWLLSLYIKFLSPFSKFYLRFQASER
jgi:hypothetical protein